MFTKTISVNPQMKEYIFIKSDVMRKCIMAWENVYKIF